MTRPSRKDRKMLRQRASNAVERGLPAPELEFGSSGSRVVASGDSSETPVTADISGATSKPPRGFASWPLSMKLLAGVAAATLILLGYSLWRTLAGSANSP